jgi:hypothetical protein
MTATAAVAVLLASAPAAATDRPISLAAAEQPRGRPRIILDRLEFPRDLPEAAHLERHLKQVLRREARRADWGAGRENRIEYRFMVKALSVQHQGDVLTVSCSAAGRLPNDKLAKSSIRFGGKPAERRKLLERVLEIVARGVVTRLAEIERIRRGG